MPSLSAIMRNIVGQILGRRDPPKINLMAAGERIITPTTISGAQQGDVLGAAPGNVWMTLTLAYLNGDIHADDPSTYPTVTVEITTDQGVVNL